MFAVFFVFWGFFFSSYLSSRNVKKLLFGKFREEIQKKFNNFFRLKMKRGTLLFRMDKMDRKEFSLELNSIF